MRTWDWKIIDHNADLIEKQTNRMAILPIDCYNDDDNDIIELFRYYKGGTSLIRKKDRSTLNMGKS